MKVVNQTFGMYNLNWSCSIVNGLGIREIWKEICLFAYYCHDLIQRGIIYSILVIALCKKKILSDFVNIQLKSSIISKKNSVSDSPNIYFFYSEVIGMFSW